MFVLSTPVKHCGVSMEASARRELPHSIGMQQKKQNNRINIISPAHSATEDIYDLRCISVAGIMAMERALDDFLHD